MALDTINDFVLQARILTQDQVQPFRYPDADLVMAFNNCVMETRRLRPDLWLNVTPLPSYVFAQTSANTASGALLPFTQLPSGLVNGYQVYDVTNPIAIAPGVTVLAFTSTQATLSNSISFPVNQGDLLAFISAGVDLIDPQYRMAFVYYMCAQAQMRDEEETEDSRAAAFMAMFKSQLLSL